MDTKYFNIIKAPVITEKSRMEAENGKYVFICDSKATKTEIKEAIEKIFKVKVAEISTLNVKTKTKRVGRYAGMTNRAKKATVKLAEGNTIELN